jgi:hypothetical protein
MTDKQKIKPTTSPTFVALFNDGVVTRMTTHCEDGKLNLGRGLALSVAAYDSRTGKPPPPIIAAKFVEPGYTDTVLKEYDATALGDASTEGNGSACPRHA